MWFQIVLLKSIGIAGMPFRKQVQHEVGIQKYQNIVKFICIFLVLSCQMKMNLNTSVPFVWNLGAMVFYFALVHHSMFFPPFSHLSSFLNSTLMPKFGGLNHFMGYH